jgi:TetR/AcrR family transcriptional regulator
MPKQTFFNLPDAKRNRIVEIAIEEFSESEYSGASISRIVNRSGIAKGSFYQYFEDKADLYEWLLYDVVGRKKVEWLSALPDSSPGDFWAVFGRLVLAGIGFGLANPRLSRLSSNLWHPCRDSDMRKICEHFVVLSRSAMRTVLENGVKGGQLRDDLDLDVASEMVLAVMQQGLDLALQRKIGVDLIAFCSHPELAVRFPEADQRVLIDQIMEMLRRAMGAAKPPQTDRAHVLPLDRAAWGFERT